MATTRNNYTAARPGTALGQLDSTIRLAQKFGPVTVPAASGSIVIPGPPQGYVRAFDAIFVGPTVVATPPAAQSVQIRVLPDLMLYATSPFGTTVVNLVRGGPLIFGESLRVTNTNAAALVNVSMTYVDIPDFGITVVRLPLTAVAQTIIPAPLQADMIHRFLQCGESIGSGRILQPRCWISNRDTVVHNYETLQNGFIIGRQGTFAANTINNPGMPPQQWPVGFGDSPLEIRLGEAVTTNQPIFWGAYEALPI